MKTKNLFSGVLLFLLTIPMVGWSTDKNDTRLTKTITRSFQVSKSATIDITNKYGEVIVNTWDEDSVHVNIEVTAFGKNDESVEKLMSRVDFDFSNFQNFLTMETIFDRKSGAVKDIINSIGDYSKSLLSKNKLNVDYEIYIPSKSTFNLNNKFGDVFLYDHQGSLKLILSHGDLKADLLDGEVELELNFGKGYVKRVMDGKIRLKGSELNIQSAGNLDIQSSSSEISLEEGFMTKIDSRSDKFFINRVQSLVGTGSFTDIKIEMLEKNLDLNLNYGSVSTETVLGLFNKLWIEGKSADIDLAIEYGAHFSVDLTARDKDLDINGVFESLTREYVDDKMKFANYVGIIGPNTQYKGVMKIDSNGGEVRLRLKDEETLSTGLNR